MSSNKNTQSSRYIEQQRRGYSIYVMESRAIPSACDGLKAAGRRVLWTARDGSLYKSAVLAGATMPIHPHSSPEDAINTITAPYGNNIPFLKGDGAFGTLINPKAYGASRYTAVKTSSFTNDVMFKDIEIIPMRENYDGTLMEPVHFLPLVPCVLLNPVEGIAIGFATNILPRSLEDIIIAQIAVLKGAKTVSNPVPKFTPLNQAGVVGEDGFAVFYGEFEQIDSTTVHITQLPYTASHESVLSLLDKLIEHGEAVDYVDNSRDAIDIKVKFKRGALKNYTEQQLAKVLGMTARSRENLNVINFSGDAIWSADPVSLITRFTEWRLQWYVNRYVRLKGLITNDLSRYYDIRLAIKHGAGEQAVNQVSRASLKQWLASIGVNDVDYIADLPIYRFTKDEHDKNEARIAAAEKELNEYNSILASPQRRRDIYIGELQTVLKKYNKGEYATTFD